MTTPTHPGEIRAPSPDCASDIIFGIAQGIGEQIRHGHGLGPVESREIFDALLMTTVILARMEAKLQAVEDVSARIRAMGVVR